MTSSFQGRLGFWVGILVSFLVAALFLTPFYVAVCYAFKSRLQVAATGLQIPTSLQLSNFVDAIQNTNESGMPFFRVMGNTLYSTVIGTVLLTFFSSMCAYAIARRTSRLYTVMYSIMVFTLLIPIQAYMFPLYEMLRAFKLLDTQNGFVLAKVGAQLGFSVIIMTGFVRTVPREIEEAAFEDGAGLLTVFVRIVVPLMKPIVLTCIVINSLNLWNDFSTAFIVLNTPVKYIVTLLQFVFMGTNSIKINLAFALFGMTMVPILVLYFALQRYIVSGIVMGSIK